MDIYIKYDEERKDGVPFNNFGISFKYGGGKKNLMYTLMRQSCHQLTTQLKNFNQTHFEKCRIFLIFLAVNFHVTPAVLRKKKLQTADGKSISSNQLLTRFKKK